MVIPRDSRGKQSHTAVSKSKDCKRVVSSGGGGLCSITPIIHNTSIYMHTAYTGTYIYIYVYIYIYILTFIYI